MGDMRTVELDDGTPGADPPRRHRRRWPWVAGAVVAVAAVLVTWQLVVNHREQSAQDRVAQASDVLLPVPEQLHVLWTAPTRANAYVGGSAVGPHLLAGSTADDGSTYEIHEVDRHTGEPGWSVTGTRPAGSTTGVECRGVSVTGGPPTFAACAIGAEQATGLLPTESTDVRIVVLVAATGEVVSTTDTTLAAWAVAGDKIVTATSERDGDDVTWSLRTIDATSGAPTWSLVLPTVPVEPPDTDANGFLTGGFFFSSLEGTLGRVVLMDQGHVWVVDEGALTTTVRVKASWTATLDRSGVAQLALGEATSATASQLVLTDGSIVDVAAQQVDLPVDDGTASNLVLVRAWKGPTLQARDPRTGVVRWEVPQAGAQALVLAGRVVVRSGDDLVAVDAGDGHVVWRTRSVMDPAVALSTDGANVYVPVPGRLRAYAVSDGHRLPDRVLPDEYGGDSPSASYGVLSVYVGDPAPILG
ncbi:PQQ-binding-like beta-propeller repeat protein [Cellulomonas sp. PhB150]|uniref:outer membrane protein assembly factor BamB family protein n=1 Tax=Cellulomonas sp. PhB150 TaxID=2485188 RepID=UPI000F46B242|nr:PQQ-binding-like beta-propeller repeat protein [Cellulomonas sp. PhB150]ROS25847.1 hypothetical protein EDF34_2169 [Cellulomonas sp. PhB150]